MNSVQSVCALVGRVFLSAIFLASAWGKLTTWGTHIDMMRAEGMTAFTWFWLAAALVVELIGALSVLIGFKARLGALVLFCFLVPTTYIFHDFWNQPDEAVQLQTIMFLKNLAIMGGLFMVVAAGPGRYSLDARWTVK